MHTPVIPDLREKVTPYFSLQRKAAGARIFRLEIDIFRLDVMHPYFNDIVVLYIFLNLMIL